VDEEAQMKFKEQAQLVTLSVVISLALVAALYQAVKPAPNANNHGLGAGDDAPIVMAGGSLYIGTSGTLTFAPDQNHTKLNCSSQMQVFKVDVFNYVNGVETPNPTNVAAATAGKVDFAYCNNGKCDNAQHTDTVTINWDANKNIWISDTAGTIQNSSLILPNLRFHSHHKWSLLNVSVNGGNPIDCGKNAESECTVIIHTCQGGNGVTCVASY
jgi:hypothetical protein